MSNDYLNSDDLDELFGGDRLPAPSLVVNEVAPVNDIADLDPQLTDDLNASRETLRAQQDLMLQMAKHMAPEVLLAENPKVLEAFTKLMAQMTSAAKATIELHRTTKSARQVAGVVKQTNQQINAENVFVGTSSELLSKLGTRQDAQEREIEGSVYDPERDRATD